MTEPGTTSAPGETAPTWLDLYDWRRRVTQMYADRERAVRRGEEGAAVVARFRAAKDDLFRLHPQSPLEDVERAVHRVAVFCLRSGFAVAAVLTPEPAQVDDAALPASSQHAMRFVRAGRVAFRLADREL